MKSLKELADAADLVEEARWELIRWCALWGDDVELSDETARLTDAAARDLVQALDGLARLQAVRHE